MTGNDHLKENLPIGTANRQSEAYPAVNCSLSRALADFLADVKSSQSPATERTYRFVLGRFFRFVFQSGWVEFPEPVAESAELNQATLAAEKQSPGELKQPAEIPVSRLQTDWAIAYMRQLATGGEIDTKPVTTRSASKKAVADTSTISPSSKATLAITAAALMRFYRWCSVERLISIPSDEFERLTVRLRQLRGKPGRTIIDKVPSDEVIETLLKLMRDKIERQTLPINDPAPKTPVIGLARYDTERQNLSALRNLALLETLRSTGARVSELCSLTGGDLDHTNKRARVVGKGQKERWLYFSSAAWQALQTYHQARARFMLQTRSNPDTEPGQKRSRNTRYKVGELAAQPVFARHDRGSGLKEIKPLTPRTIQKMLWELVEEAGVFAQITPHKFRHWFATKLLAGTGDLAVTQDLLGHANPATTRIYAQVSETKKQTAHRDVFN